MSKVTLKTASSKNKKLPGCSCCAQNNKILMDVVEGLLATALIFGLP